MNKKIYTWFVSLGVLAGFLHILLVSFLHRENFIELWFFTTAGAIQLFLGIYAILHKDKWVFFVPAFIFVHLALFTLWLATRIFPAPFLTFPEAFGVIDIVVAVLELVAIILGIKILLRYNKNYIIKLLIFAFLFGGLNYVTAKASEDIIKSIPVQSEVHAHSFFNMFKNNQENHDNSDGHHDNVEEMVDQIIVTPDGHDNSDGHHDE